MWMIEVLKAVWNQMHARNNQRHLRSDNIRSFRAETVAFVNIKPKQEFYQEQWYGRAVFINGERRMIKF